MSGKAIIFSAPSGAGKTTIVRFLQSILPELSFSVSACSREKRNYETHGTDYYFYSSDEFKGLIAEEKFAEWEEVYPNHFYGTLKSEIDRVWAEGKTIIFDVDVIGGIRLKKYFEDNALSVFVKPPNFRTLENRLRGRGTETEEKIQLRLKKATQELLLEDMFDFVLVNDDLDKAKAEAEEKIKTFINA